MVTGIYKITNIVNGHSYIGQSVNIVRRKRTHFLKLEQGEHYNRYLQRAYNKYGKENFSFTILVRCSRKNLTILEQFLVDELSPEYNIQKECVVSQLGVKYSEEVNKRRSERLTGQRLSIEHCKAISEAHKGMTASEETKKKMREAQRIRRLTPVSEETGRRISEANKGKKKKPFGESTKKRMKEAWVRRKERKALEKLTKIEQISYN